MPAPEVGGIARGKAHRKYEFGCKVRVVTTARRNWVTGIDAVHDNPYKEGIASMPSSAAVRLTCASCCRLSYV
jgi:hypothetical protein